MQDYGNLTKDDAKKYWVQGSLVAGTSLSDCCPLVSTSLSMCFLIASVTSSLILDFLQFSS